MARRAGQSPVSVDGSRGVRRDLLVDGPYLDQADLLVPAAFDERGERLSYYAGQFPIVEADSTYYRPLPPELARTWAERVPAGFFFDIKAYGLLTGHPVEQASLWPDLKEELSEDAREKRRIYAHHLAR